MKQRLITVFLLLFASFLLTGCDMFGGGETTTTTTTTQSSGIYHTVVFYDSDDSILTTQNVLEGEGANAPSNPTKASNAQYTYTFNNWDTVFSNVTTDLHVRPVFTTALNMYTVTFYDMDDTELGEQTIAYGSGATAPASPTYGPTAEFTYTFSGWDVDFSNIVGNLDVTAEYTSVTNQYTVTFYDENGTTVLGTSTVNYGTGATAPATPTKAADAENTYVFTGWSVDFSNVTADISTIAVFVSTNVEYTVTFYTEDGTTVLGTSVVAYGIDATAPAAPTKDATAEFTYTFSGWSEAITNVSSTFSVNAVFTSVVNQYTVTFYDDDGITVLGTSTVAYGTEATAPVDPFKASDVTNAYAFDGWNNAFNNVIADTSITATYLTVLLGQTYTVNFYDSMGTIIDTQTIAHGESATAPTLGLAKTSDVQYDYTFFGWSEFFVTVTSDLEIQPVYDMEVILYTVTFYDTDETTVLWTGQVGYGSPATAPTSPTKADGDGMSYTFISWDTGFSMVTENLEIYPVFIGQPTGTFNRQSLLNLISVSFNEEDPESMILEMLAVTEMTSEEELFILMTNAMSLVEQLPFIDSADEMQSWYAATKTLGFDKDMIIAVLYNAMVVGAANTIESNLEEIAFYTAELAEKAQLILDYEAQLLAFDAEASNYCLTGVDSLLSVKCQDYWTELKNLIVLENTFEFERDMLTMTDYEFDWSVWHRIEDVSRALLFAQMITMDPTIEALKQADYDDYMSGLSPEQVAFYTPLMVTYLNYQTASFNVYNSTMWNVLDAPDLGGVDSPRYILDVLFNGDGDYSEGDIYYLGYGGYTNMIKEVEWSIQNIEDIIAEMQENNADEFFSPEFIMDPLNETILKQVMETLYDGLDAVILVIDEEMFDMVKMVVMDMLYDPQNNNRPELNSNPMDMITPENIVMIAEKLNIVLTAFYDTLDQDDFDNLKVLLLSYLDDMFENEGMTLVERTAYLAVIETTYDKYVIHFNFLVGEVKSFLGSLDETKVMSVMKLIPEDFDMMTDIDMAILVSKGIDALIGDDSLDISGLIQVLTDVYFDVSTELNPDPTVVAAVQAAIDLFMTDTLALVDIIKDLNPTYLSETNIEQIVELMGRIDAIMTWFTDGFEEVLVPVEYYSDDLFDEFIWNFLDGEEPSIMLTMLTGVLGTIDKEDTYYKVRSLFQYAIGILNIRSFEGVQEWVGGLESFGHTQAEWVDYLVNLLKVVTDEGLEGDKGFLIDMADYLDQLDNYQGMIDDVNVALTQIDTEIIATIDLLESGLRADGSLYWSTSVENMMKYRIYSDTGMTLSYMLDAMYIEELYGIVKDIYNAENPFDQTAYDLAMAEFDAFEAMHGSDDYINELIHEYKENFYEYYTFKVEVYDPMTLLIQANPAYLNLEDRIADYVNEYTIGELDIMMYENEMMNIQERIADMEESLWFVNVVWDLVNDPTIEPLTENVINIVLDDLQNMILSMPPESFELLEKVMTMMMGVNDYRNIENFDDGPDMFDIPFSPEELFVFSQDLSAFLKLRLDTIDPAEMVLLESYIHIFITEYVADMDLDPTEQTAYISEINGLVLKYLGYTDEVLTELTNFLDGLTVQSITDLLDYVTVMTDGGMNIYEQIIRGAQVIDGLYDPAEVDLAFIIGILNEIYFDIEYGTYTPTELANVQMAWSSHLTDVEALIATAAALNPDMLDPADFAVLIELLQKVMYMENLVENPEDILTIPTFGFDYQMLVDIVSEMFENDEPGEIDAMIIELCAVFNLGPTDFEELYYIAVGVGSVIQGMQEIESPFDVLAVLEGVLSLGYTNVEIASFVMNGLMTYLVPELPNMTDTTDLEADLTLLEDDLLMAEDDLLLINDEVEIVIGNETSILAQTAAYDLWDAYNLREQHYAKFDFKLNNYSVNNEMFQMWIWSDLADANDIDDTNFIDITLNGMEQEEREMYQDLLDCYNDYMRYENELVIKQNDFAMNYGTIEVYFQVDYYLSDYLYDQSTNLTWLYMVQFENIYEIERINKEIEEIEDMAWLPQTMELLLADPANEALTEQVLVILLDQLEAWTVNPDVNFLESFMMIFDKGLEGMNAAELSAELMNAGTFIQGLFNTMDPADEAILESWLLEVVDAFAETQTSDPAELAALKAYLNTMVTNYLPGVLDIPAEIGDFMLTMDETKTQALMDQLMILSMLDDSNPKDEVLMVITIANIIDLLAGDGSLDYDAIYHPIFGIVYGVNFLQGNPPATDLLVLQALIDGELDDLLAQAAIVALIDPATTDLSELAAIQLIIEMVEALGDNIGPLFGEEQEPGLPA